MTEELITFETAMLAKQKGFDEECMNKFEWYVYDGKEFGPFPWTTPRIDFRQWNVKAEETQKRPLLYNKCFWPEKNSQLKPFFYARPTQDLMERWLREVHSINISIEHYLTKIIWKYKACVLGKDSRWYSPGADTYELAREAALLHALKLL